MIFMIQAYLNKAAFAACPDKEAIYSGEVVRARQARADRRLLGFYRRADCNGSVIIGDFESHEHLMTELQSLPMFKFWSHVEVLPLVSHPVFPDYANSGEPGEASATKSIMPEGF